MSGSFSFSEEKANSHIKNVCIRLYTSALCICDLYNQQCLYLYLHEYYINNF